MSRERPASPEWARYYRAHPEVVASWGESNGREPNCRCPSCRPAETECAGNGERWERRSDGAAGCPVCGAAWWRLVARRPGRARVGGGFLGHVPEHRTTPTVTTRPPASLPLLDGSDVLRDLGDWKGP